MTTNHSYSGRQPTREPDRHDEQARDQQSRPPAELDDLTRYTDARVQAVERVRRMISLFTINIWEQRFADPLAPHALAYLYLQHDQRRKGYFQITAAWQLWLEHPDVRVLPRLLFELHHQLAPRAAGPGFDIRDELSVGRDAHMASGAAGVYAGLAVISLDTAAGSWEKSQKTAKSALDLPAVARIVLTDGALMACHHGGRQDFNSFTVEATCTLSHGTVRALCDWSFIDPDTLRRRETDREVLRWAGELSDTLAQADNGRIAALQQAEHGANRTRGRGRV
ncbi:hypothetical protein AB0B66_23950 [Catellatospora sp. NPDC049111]|uniref:hypothetical protein n=1 Tax=Catellatospora sp. NPDC049111 TaxID=3155271 RepID=UPI0033EF435E